MNRSAIARRPRRGAAVAVAALGLGLLNATPSRAEPYVVGAPEALVAFVGGPYIGVGGSATLGWGLDLEPLLVAPEISLAAHVLPAAGAASLLRATAGGRVGLTAFVEPSLYARMGAGMTDARDATSASGGLAIDAGGALDVRPSRDLTLGGHVGYAGLAALGNGRSVHALALGARVGIWF